MIKRFLCALYLAFSLMAPAYADDIRDFNADTPGKTYSPFTVAEGYWQYESDVFHTINVSGSQTIETLDPVLKYGVSANIEAELAFGGFYSTTQKIGDKTVHLEGFGDIVPKVKWNVIGNDSGWFSAAIIAGVKIPTAQQGIGNGVFEYYFVLPTQISLPNDFSIQVQEEVDVLKNQINDGKSLNYSEDISLAKNFTPNLMASIELFMETSTDHYFKPEYTFDLGLGYNISKTFVVSSGLYVGLNKYSSTEFYTGFAFRF